MRYSWWCNSLAYDFLATFQFPRSSHVDFLDFSKTTIVWKRVTIFREYVARPMHQKHRKCNILTLTGQLWHTGSRLSCALQPLIIKQQLSETVYTQSCIWLNFVRCCRCYTTFTSVNVITFGQLYAHVLFRVIVGFQQKHIATKIVLRLNTPFVARHVAWRSMNDARTSVLFKNWRRWQL